MDPWTVRSAAHILVILLAVGSEMVGDATMQYCNLSRHPDNNIHPFLLLYLMESASQMLSFPFVVWGCDD